MLKPCSPVSESRAIGQPSEERRCFRLGAGGRGLVFGCEADSGQL